MELKNSMIELLSSTDYMIIKNKPTQEVEYTTDNMNWIRKKLNFAGFDSEFAPYIFIVISIITGVFMGGFIFVLVDSVIAFALSLMMFSFFPTFIIVKIGVKREEEFNLFLKEMIDKITSMMKSGVGFDTAMKKAILTTHSQLTKNIFNIYLSGKDLIGEDKAFEKMFQMINSRELRIFYLTISIGRSSGGKFSNTLEKLRKTLHQQGEIKQQVISSTKEITIGSYMIIAIVVLIFVLMNHSLEGILYKHFFGTQIGKIQFFFIIIWVCFGLFINNLLTKIKT